MPETVFSAATFRAKNWVLDRSFFADLLRA